MISKELLSEVLNVESVIDDVSFIEKWNTIIYYIHSGNERTINIYELAHRCKEWAFKKEFRISSQFVVKGEFTSSWAKVQNWISGDCDCLKRFNCDTEPEAIFKACQWILDNKEIE